MKKILSIIIPSYNMEAYLPKCLGSLMFDNKELLQKLEVIVVNDGSRDRTSEIAHHFEIQYPEVIRVIDKPNGHYGSCINAGLEAAKGMYVKTLDADDSYGSAEFEKYMQAVEKLAYGTREVDLILNDFVEVDANDRITKVVSLPFQRNEIFDFCKISKSGEILQHFSIAYRRDMLKEMGYRQTEGIAYTDNEWDSYPMFYVKSAAYADIMLYRYFIGRPGQSVSAGELNKNALVLDRISDRVLVEFKDLMGKADQSHRQYANLWMDFFIWQTYCSCFFMHPLMYACRRLRHIDKIIRDIAPVAWELLPKHFTLFSSTRLAFSYLKLCRKCSLFPFFVIVGLRVYYRLRRGLNKNK